jgi:hypothetical protein
MTESQKRLAVGMVQTLEPVAAEYEKKVGDVYTSQELLGKQIDLLTSELEIIAKGASDFPRLRDHTARITVLRRRLGGVGSTLSGVVSRIQRMEGQLKMLKEKSEEADKSAPSTKATIDRTPASLGGGKPSMEEDASGDSSYMPAFVQR